ncbi:MAG TPA: hypothetical protein VMH81_15065 [Bryobacteraceae bacterium]|nr:hypothetical protein [Bryobacteraceae bacterium]
MPSEVTVTFGPGLYVRGVVLSISNARLRIAMPDWEDAAEFQLHQGKWFLENRDPVDIVWRQSLHAASESLKLGRTRVDPGLPCSAWVN